MYTQKLAGRQSSQNGTGHLLKSTYQKPHNYIYHKTSSKRPAFIRTRALEPRCLIETRCLLEYWPQAPAFITVKPPICSGFMLILLLIVNSKRLYLPG